MIGICIELPTFRVVLNVVLVLSELVNVLIFFVVHGM